MDTLHVLADWTTSGNAPGTQRACVNEYLERVGTDARKLTAFLCVFQCPFDFGIFDFHLSVECEGISVFGSVFP